MAEQEIEVTGRTRELFACITWEGFIPNKHRRKVDLLLKHRDPTVSNLSHELLREDEFQRQLSAARRERELELLADLEREYEIWLKERSIRLGDDLTQQLDG